MLGSSDWTETRLPSTVNRMVAMASPPDRLAIRYATVPQRPAGGKWLAGQDEGSVG
jgi:hypothetical protein